MADSSGGPPRWQGFVSLILSIIGTTLVVGGGLLAFGGWRSTVDTTLADHDKRLTVVETTQRANLPTFYRMQSDLSYLADHARAEEQRERERER